MTSGRKSVCMYVCMYVCTYACEHYLLTGKSLGRLTQPLLLRGLAELCSLRTHIHTYIHTKMSHSLQVNNTYSHRWCNRYSLHFHPFILMHTGTFRGNAQLVQGPRQHTRGCLVARQNEGLYLISNLSNHSYHHMQYIHTYINVRTVTACIYTK
jgi:hypothetical protein